MPSRNSEATVENPEQPVYPKWTVTVAATTLATGRLNPQNRKPEVVRLVRGDVINAPEDNPSIQTLLSMRAIVPSDKFDGRDNRLNTRRVFTLFRRANVATADVVKQVEPVDAPAQTESV